ncbi:MAG: hypothetical protein HZB62_06200 [Nitrospirae bacterium]|nr:hypothetical protein [Nitrospirota bacterium]
MADKLQATEEQLEYAKLLNIGMKLGLLMLLISFTIYVLGIFTPHVPVGDLPKYWSMPVKDYLKATDIHTGWSWIHLLGKGDFLNFVGIAFLSGVTILCYIRIIPILFKKKDTVYAVLAIIEVLVLVLAASGVLKAGGH